MNGFAALAVTPAAHASGIGQGLLPGIAPSLLDGFAVGALLSGACVLLVLASRRGVRRSRLASRDADWTQVAQAAVNPGYLDYLPAPVNSDPLSESAEVVMNYPASRPRENRQSTGRHAAKSVSIGR